MTPSSIGFFFLLGKMGILGGPAVGGLGGGGLVIGGLGIGCLGVAAGEENTPEPEESKDSPNSGVARIGMSHVRAGVEPGKRVLGWLEILGRQGIGERLNSGSFLSPCLLLVHSSFFFSEMFIPVKIHLDKKIVYIFFY